MPSFGYCTVCDRRVALREDGCCPKGHPCAAEEPGRHADDPEPSPFSGERKRASIMFSDLSGYTALSESLDPEDAREILEELFSEAASIVERYGGQVDKLIGDEIMAIFGVPVAREDDSIRAVAAAQEIHRLADGLSRGLEARTGHTLRMHSGINTGLVVAGERDESRGRDTVMGDTVNVAARLANVAQPGEIVVGAETARAAESRFSFESLGELDLKGKSAGVGAYRLDGPSRAAQVKTRRARLVGRSAETEQLAQALERLRSGRRSIVSVSGEAGTGKSRLVAEFRELAEAANATWLEGKAYGFTETVPYHLLTDLLGSAWGIEADDDAAARSDKLRTRAEPLLRSDERLLPFVGALFGLESAALEKVDPDTWRQSVDTAMLEILGSLANRGPTVVHLEDVHWADEPSLGILRTLLRNDSIPVLLLYTFRPRPGLPIDGDGEGSDADQVSIRLDELLPEQSREMLESLLGESTVSPGVVSLLRVRGQGNPFFIEEIVSWLIDEGALAEGGGAWDLTSAVESVDIPPTVQGVIAARIDGLDPLSKTVLQEAAVLGRRFRVPVMELVSQTPDLRQRLAELESLDLIRPVGQGADPEYSFKHALTQEVAYESLLRSERSSIHLRAGNAVETVYPSRLSEQSETLALHFDRGGSHEKSVHYYMLSGAKAMAQCALTEADDYYRRAHEILSESGEHAGPETTVELVNRWSYVLWYQQRNGDLLDLLLSRKESADSVQDLRLRGAYESWLGLAFWGKVRMPEAYEHLQEALRLGEEAEDESVVGYACARLAMVAGDCGLLRDAVAYGDRAMAIAGGEVTDPELFSFAGCYAGVANLYLGDLPRTREIADELLEYAEANSHTRSYSMGYFVRASAHMMDGDYENAISWFDRSVRVSKDPLYSVFPLMLYGAACTLNGEYARAEGAMRSVAEQGEARGNDFFANVPKPYLGAALIAQGRMSEGLKLAMEGTAALKEGGATTEHGISEAILGEVFSELSSGDGDMSVRDILRNSAFLVRHVPGAARRAEAHLLEALRIFDESESAHLAGWAGLALGRLYAATKRSVLAEEALRKSIAEFTRAGITTDRARAMEELASLEGG